MAQDVLEVLTAERCGHGKAHNLVPQYLRSASHPDGTAAANLLADLHSERIKADYRLSNTDVETAQYARLQVETAVEVQRLLASFKAACEADPDLRDALRGGVENVKRIHRA